ncbi:hypothetical protein [Flavobacterium sp. MK4S-17]|uniref:hypothetical protein n=1 Tax=Flavobacterium sp. MK4S-17 TaxID=2543737 RepID=UPI00135AAB7A|nr:hypothetical protein [Flavobacterium sp. MK4S-17]
MKAITSSIVLLSLMAACSPEDTVSDMTTIEQAAYNKQGAVSPSNPANPYDHIGSIYRNLLDSYYAIPHQNLTLEQVISGGEALLMQDQAFLTLLKNEPYVPVTAEEIQPYLDVEGNISALLDQRYGLEAVEIYQSVTNTLEPLLQADAPYSEIRAALIAIEDLAIHSEELSEADRAVVLTTISIVRNALHKGGKPRRRDRDWEWMIGNIAATANATLDSKPQAIMACFATDVY